MKWKPFARSTPAAPLMADGMVVFAVGDVHGRADLLELMLRYVVHQAQIEAQQGLRALFIGLGDYIDRGPRSREVIDQLLALKTAPDLDVRYLRGNHERILLNFLADPARTGPSWCTFGGREALQSYGVAPPEFGEGEEAWLATRDALLAALPPSHLAFFSDLETSIAVGDYFFAHAGAKPGVPLEDQVEDDLLWIRAPFLSDRRRFDKIVVHGHSPDADVHIDGRRIGLDTGAYATGVLSVARFKGESRELVQTHRTEDGYVLRVATL